MKKFYWLLSLLVVVGISLGINTGKAQAASTDKLEEGLKYIESSEAYIQYLKTEGTNNPEALTILKQFESLSKEDQNTFLTALKPDNYIKILDTLSGEQSNTSLAIGNKEVPIESAIEQSGIETRASSKTTTASYSLYVLGIKTTTLYSTVVFEYGSDGAATKVVDYYGSDTNYNPSFILTKNTGNGYLEGQYAIGRATWTAYASGSLGFINDTVNLFVKAKRDIRGYKVTSTRASWETAGWVSF